MSGSEKGVFWKRGVLENLEIVEILENSQTVENKGESDHFPENLEILEILEIPPVLSALKSQRFLRFAIAMPTAAPGNRAISETRESNVALRFKGAMESR